MEEIEKFPCNNYIEASKRERYWIENLKSTLNKVVPSRTKKEWENEHKEQMSEYIKQYRTDNKDIIKENKALNYQVYRETHKEQKSEKDKEYREKNKDKFNQKINCICGGTYSYSHKSTHLKTKLHQNFINNTEKIDEHSDI
jgi:hypothetical protein